MRNSEHTKNQIIAKATTLFNTKGYRGTSLSDITKATGMTKGAIYGNFENKDDLAVAAFEASVIKIMSGLNKYITEQPTAPLKLKAIINYYSEYILNPPIAGGCPIINTSVEADDAHPLLRLRVVSILAIIKDSLKKIISRGIQEYQINKDIDVELYALMFYATIEGAIVMARIEGTNRSYDIIKKGLEKQVDAISL
ncbi:MAG: TetR/AcrR family transcriptional repressor of nem operon [Cyclobacteriaceae bacterium]|jgi:TetR/AcrR family transcriptional repressor of nem operon